MSEKIRPFFEPEELAAMDGIQFDMHSPKKCGERLVVGDLPDEGTNVGLYGTVLRDPWNGKFRMWYTGTKPRNLARYAESDDGIHWTKPNVADEKWVEKEYTNAVIDGQFPVVIADAEAEDEMDRYRMFHLERPHGPHPLEGRVRVGAPPGALEPGLAARSR